MLCKAYCNHKIKETKLHLLTLQGFICLLNRHSVYGSSSKCKQDAYSLLLFIRGNVRCLQLQYQKEGSWSSLPSMLPLGLFLKQKLLSFYQRTGKIYYTSFGLLTSLSFTTGRHEYMSLLHCKEICVIRLRNQISSKSCKHTRVLISSNLKINVVDRLPIFLALATPPELKAKKIYVVCCSFNQALFRFQLTTEVFFMVLESRASTRFQMQHTNGSQKGDMLLNV